MRAMTMLDKAELQYSDLMKKKTTVETDKEKIKKVLFFTLRLLSVHNIQVTLHIPLHVGHRRA